MKFFRYITEKEYKASPKEIKDVAKKISKRIGVKEKDLKFIGVEDYGDMGKLFHFNLTDPTHEKYKSTVAELIK